MNQSSSKPKVLIQLDADPQPSAFDQIVALDATVDHVLAYGGVTIDQIETIVHGAIFTRGGADLAHTAIFVGGSDVSVGQSMLERVVGTFFGPMRVSVMLDANGANTTAAAAVLCAAGQWELSSSSALVLAGTGPVGQRVVRLLARQGSKVKLGSRSAQRAATTAKQINNLVRSEAVVPCATSDDNALDAALDGVQVVIAAGKTGTQLLPKALRLAHPSLRVCIDLNAVPPAGIEGVEPIDKAVDRDNMITFGAIGVGGRKMKIHKAALRSLFDRNDHVLDAESIYDLAQNLDGS